MNITKQMCGRRFNVDFENFPVISIAFICTKICELIIWLDNTRLFGFFHSFSMNALFNYFHFSLHRSSIRIGILGLYCLTCHTPKYSFKLCTYLWFKTTEKMLGQMCMYVCASIHSGIPHAVGVSIDVVRHIVRKKWIAVNTCTYKYADNALLRWLILNFTAFSVQNMPAIIDGTTQLNENHLWCMHLIRLKIDNSWKFGGKKNFESLHYFWIDMSYE